MIAFVLATLFALVQVVAAYVVVDFLTGVYHFATDKGFNVKSQVAMFQLHHDTNTMEGFDWQPMLVGVPGMLIGLWLESPFVLALGAFGILAQVPHYYAHVRSKSPIVHAVVRWLQSTGLIISPKHHASHHRDPFSRDFCILSGWNNRWTNRAIEAFEDRDYGPGMATFPIWSIVGGLACMAVAGSSVLLAVVFLTYSAVMR